MRRLAWIPATLVAAAWLMACGDGAVAPTEPAGAEVAPEPAAKKLAGTEWTVPGDFATIQEAMDSDAVQDGDRIAVGPGRFAGANVTKAVEIKGRKETIIDDGPELGGSGLYTGFFFDDSRAGSGATISHLAFETVEFPVMSRGADNVTVSHNQMANALQGISNWGGSGWVISHNKITDLRSRSGGGIGILVADRAATPGGVNDNVISHNRVSGTLHVWEDDCGDYNGSGIVVYADFRGGRQGALEITGNRIVKNKVALVSDTPDLVDVAAIELTDTRADPDLDPVIYGNAVGFNDLRGTALQIVLTPANLDEVNDISRNQGKSRGHGKHPSAFGPGGN